VVDLNQTLEIEFTEKVKKPNGGVMIRAMVPGITNKWAMPLHLNEEQAEALGDPSAGDKFKVKLIKGTMKDNKTGEWPTDWYYNVVMFEGVVEERNIKRETHTSFLDTAPPVKEETILGAPVNKDRPAYGSQPFWINNSVIFKGAVDLSLVQKGKNNAEYVDNVYWNHKLLTDIYYGDYEPSALTKAIEEAGGKVSKVIENLKSSVVADEWDYKKPKLIKTNGDFWVYTEKCGWIKEDVIKWLDGLDIDEWCDQKGKTYLYAAKICKDKALEQGLEPPYDYRQKKETNGK